SRGHVDVHALYNGRAPAIVRFERRSVDVLADLAALVGKAPFAQLALQHLAVGERVGVLLGRLVGQLLCPFLGGFLGLVVVVGHARLLVGLPPHAFPAPAPAKRGVTGPAATVPGAMSESERESVPQRGPWVGAAGAVVIVGLLAASVAAGWLSVDEADTNPLAAPAADDDARAGDGPTDGLSGDDGAPARPAAPRARLD